MLLTVLFGCTKFKHYIVLSQFSMEVQCPRDGLKDLLNQAQPIGRMARLMINLQQYDLDFKVEKGQRAQQTSLLLDFSQPEDSREGEY